VNHDASEGYKVEEVEGPPFSISQGDKMKLPPANNFAEGQRYIYGLLASAGGMFCGAASGLMVALLMWGGWSAAEQHTIITIFGWALGAFILAMIVVIVGLLAGGPVGRFKLIASRDSASIEADSNGATA
jgi:hypothetical protein